MAVVRLYGEDLYGVANPYDEARGDVSPALRVLTTLSTDEMLRYTLECSRRPRGGLTSQQSSMALHFALRILSDAMEARRACDLAVAWLGGGGHDGSYFGRPSLGPLLRALAFDPVRAKAGLDERQPGFYWHTLHNLSHLGRESGVRLPQDVCQGLLLIGTQGLQTDHRHQGLQTGGAGWENYRNIAPDAYLNLVRAFSHISVDPGLQLDVWHTAMNLACTKYDENDSSAGCKLVDEIAEEALGAGVCMWADDERVPLGRSPSGTSAMLWNHTDDAEELWTWECYLARAEAAVLSSTRPAHRNSPLLKWFKPSGKLVQILQDASRPEGFLACWRGLVVAQCRRPDVLFELVGLLKEGKHETELGGTVFDLFGSPLWEMLLAPDGPSPLYPRAGPRGKIGYGFSDSINVYEVIGEVSRLKRRLTEFGLLPAFTKWIKAVVRASLRDLGVDAEVALLVMDQIDFYIGDASFRQSMHDELLANIQDDPQLRASLTDVIVLHRELDRLSDDVFRPIAASSAAADILGNIQADETKVKWQEYVQPRLAELELKLFKVVPEDPAKVEGFWELSWEYATRSAFARNPDWTPGESGFTTVGVGRGEWEGAGPFGNKARASGFKGKGRKVGGKKGTRRGKKR